MNTDKLEIDPITDAAFSFALACMREMEDLIADGMSASEARLGAMEKGFSLVLSALSATDSEAAKS